MNVRCCDNKVNKNKLRLLGLHKAIIFLIRPIFPSFLAGEFEKFSEFGTSVEPTKNHMITEATGYTGIRYDPIKRST